MQTERRTDGHTDKETDRRADGRTDREADAETDGQIDIAKVTVAFRNLANDPLNYGRNGEPEQRRIY
jgi:hypothetical protein